MAARSIIARHPRRADIEKAIRAGVSVRAVAGQFDIDHLSAVARYRRGLLAGDEERRREAEGLSEVDRLARRLDGLWDLLATHLGSLDPAATPRLDKTALEVVREARNCVREIANLRGLLRPGVQIGIGVTVNNPSGGGPAGEAGTVPPDEVKAALFRVMRRHPEARDELVEEFQRVQARHDAGVLDAEVVDLEVLDAGVLGDG